MLAGATYVAGYAMAGDNLPRNASVSGVQVGGISPSEAATKLKEQLGSKAEAPITVQVPAVGGNPAVKTTLKPADAGLALDYDATIAQAGAGKSWSPVHIWQVLSGGGDLKPVTAVDDAKLAKAVEAQAPKFAVDATNATLALKGTEPTLTEGKPAIALDAKATAAAVKKAYLSSTDVKATTTSTPPAITTEAAKKVLDEKLKPELAAPITVKTSKGSWTITPEQIAKATTISPDVKGKTIAVKTDAEKLYEASDEERTKLGLVGGKDAKITLVDGKPSITPSTDGDGVKKEDFVKAVTNALPLTGNQRTVTLAVAKAPAEFTTADAKKMGVKEVTGEFTTYFPYADYRNTNLSVAASRVNNTYVAPGEIFSMNDTIGPRTAGSGFVDGWVISGDHLVKENAGGISQSGTTAFNALFFSGLEHIEHQPHTMYFDRYPAGREATLYYGNIDVKFRNNTPYGVLMQAWVNKASEGTKGSITVRVWSTKIYDVKSTDLVKSNFTTGTTLHRSGPDCHAQAASQGFTVNYARLFYKGGQLVKREPYTWTYQPTDEIICD